MKIDPIRAQYATYLRVDDALYEVLYRGLDESNTESPTGDGITCLDMETNTEIFFPDSSPYNEVEYLILSPLPYNNFIALEEACVAHDWDYGDLLDQIEWKKGYATHKIVLRCLKNARYTDKEKADTIYKRYESTMKAGATQQIL